MTYEITDYNQFYILLADSIGREIYIPKMAMQTVVAEPEITIEWSIPYVAGKRNKTTINYNDISEGYGYGATYPNAQAVADAIWTMRISQFSGGGDILTAKGDLLSHNGVSDAILPIGTNGRILMTDSGESVGMLWQDPSTLFTGKTSALIIPTITGATSSMTDGATYYWGSSGAFGANTNQGLARIYNLTGKTITIVAISTFIRWTTGTSESSTVYLRYNNTTDYSLGTVDGNVAQTELSLTGQNIAWADGDYVEMKMVNPTWATNPSNMSAGGQIHCLSPIS